MTNPNPGPLPQPRLRPNRAPSSPALGGAGGPPFWDEPLARPMRRAFYGRRRVAADAPLAVTPTERARIERNIATLIDLLDSIDAPEQDMEDGDSDCCPAGDDDPASSRPMSGGDAPTDPADDEGSLGWAAGGQVGTGDTPLFYDLEGDNNPDAEDDDPGEDNGDKEPSLGWTLEGENGDAADDDRELDTIDDEAETDQGLTDDEPDFPHREFLRKQMAMAGHQPGDVVPVRHVGRAGA